MAVTLSQLADLLESKELLEVWVESAKDAWPVKSARFDSDGDLMLSIDKDDDEDDED